MSDYRRLRIAGGRYFFTVNVADRASALLTSHIRELKTSFADTRRILPFRIDAIVILPEHLHCIWTLPPDDADSSARWQLIKGNFSRHVAAQETRSRSRARRRERGVWQRRFWEHAIRHEASYAAHLDYIHYNAVKHGYATAPGEWPYSSFGRFVQAGLYPRDWAACPALSGNMGER